MIPYQVTAPQWSTLSLCSPPSPPPPPPSPQFLADTFNALFDIMEERGEEFGDPVFEALVLIIGLLGVEKYENFRPVLDTYCDKLFKAANVHT